MGKIDAKNLLGQELRKIYHGENSNDRHCMGETILQKNLWILLTTKEEIREELKEQGGMQASHDFQEYLKKGKQRAEAEKIKRYPKLTRNTVTY